MSLTITRQVQFNGGARGRKRIEEAGPRPDVPVGRVPRISRLMALAIRMDRLIRGGHVGDYAELARMGHVSRASPIKTLFITTRARHRRESRLNSLRKLGLAMSTGSDRKRPIGRATRARCHPKVARSRFL